MEAHCGFSGGDAEEVGLQISDTLEGAAPQETFICCTLSKKSLCASWLSPNRKWVSYGTNFHLPEDAVLITMHAS